MRKFLGILLAVMLTVCFSSAVLAISSMPIPEGGDDTKLLIDGQEVDPGTLTPEQLAEIYGYNTLKKSSSVMAAMDADATSLVIPSIETLYGDAIDAAIKKDRNDLLGDIAAVIMEQGTGGGAYQDPGQYSPYEASVHIIEYVCERAREMGFEEDQIVKVMAPNYTVPPHKRSARLPGMTDREFYDAPSMYPLYMYVELGDKSLPEVVFSVQHTDPWEDTSGTRGDRGGWTNDPFGEVYPTPIHVSNPNRFWTLGGSHQANVIRDPVTMRWVMVGRGTDDDRGPGIAMLYAMKAIKDSGIPLRRRIRTCWGTTEDATTMYRTPYGTATTYGRPYLGATSSFGDMAWYGHQDEMFVAGFTGDSGVVPIMYGQQSSSASITNLQMRWTYTPTSIGLRFPNALRYRAENAGGTGISAAQQWGSGGGTNPSNFTDGAPTALPAILYNQGRDAYEYKAYYAGVHSGTDTGQSMELVAWLVPPVAPTSVDVLALFNAANAVKNNTRINWGGWEYPDEKNDREAVQKVAVSGRWDSGLEVLFVNTKNGKTANAANVDLISADAIQVITRGHVTRFWEKEYFSARHIMVDFLSKIVVPSGLSAPWQNSMRQFIALYPFENFRERKVWNGNTLVGGNLGKNIYAGTLSSINSFAPQFATTNMPATDSGYTPARVENGVSHAAQAWTNRKTNASIAFANQGRNDENVTGINMGIAFTFSSCVTPDDNVHFNGLVHGTLVSPAVRARLNELGITATVANSANVTGTMYVRADHDALHKTMKAYNNYYKRFGVPDPGYTGEVKEDRPDFIAGGTYANSFRYMGALQEGRMIAIGGWGGRGTLHGWNERVELDGFVDFAKRGARTYAEVAAGVPHTWAVTGTPVTPANGYPYRGFPEKGKLRYAISNDVVSDIYLQEEIVVKPIVAKLYSENKIPREEETEILFARKFWQGQPITLTVNLTDADGVALTHGTVYLFAKEAAGALSDLDANWELAATGAAGTAQVVFADNGVYDQRTVSNDVEVSVIALVVTDGASTPFSVAGDAEEDTTLRDKLNEIADSKVGCNAGFAILAFAFLPFVIRRRK